MGDNHGGNPPPEKTLHQWARQEVTQQPLCMTYLAATNLELKSGLIYLLPTFRGLENEDPYKFLTELHVVCIDDEDVFVDNTQVEGTSQATKPKKRKYVQRATCWVDYDVIHIKKVRYSKCKKCGTLLKTESGRNVGELPFKFVENESFIEYTNALNGKVVLPCRTTISNRVIDFYLEEKAKLFKFFSNPLSNVHLTTDCWTSSCQRSSYMVVMAHFIDEDWVMHKRIINFKSQDSHKGEDIGRTLLTCLQE
ncbi:zinc finger BED domain-containing protein RICESLEEPER 2-like [Lactuca sativa]|uniref:zinc finger BED domain-containing protein RICESLEEPER 2-like n=1 Tax=Lactuca sativa TaxID=4236 RepID=UPI000CD9BCC7|nr:zinc finger BED domain-containing protein RICESLEEPER 2-like [Lactuca sativa]